MRVVIQRVSRAAVTVDDEVVGSIDGGYCLLVGVSPGDGETDIEPITAKIADLRLFGDEEGKMNRSLVDIGGEVLVVSQFTLLGNAAKGRRPSFTGAASPDIAAPLVGKFIECLRAQGIKTESGRFGARMVVEIFNDGPVTMVLDFESGRLI